MALGGSPPDEGSSPGGEALSAGEHRGEATFYAHDGELTRRPAVGEDGRYTLTCRIVPKALRVYAPAPSRQEDVLESTTR